MTDEAWTDTVRLARDFGSVSSLLPDWCRGIHDAPWLLFDAIRSALVFLSFDELPKKEVPPRRIWLDGERLSEWFRQVKINREREMRGDGSSDPEDGEMEQNAAAEGLLIG
jgi:hypothetical protein